MTSALTKHLTDEITNVADNPEATKTARRRARSLRDRISGQGPSSYTVSETAVRTGIPVTVFLHMTPSHHWHWETPPPTYVDASQTLAASHIFDSYTVLAMEREPELETALQSLQLAAPFVTEKTMQGKSSSLMAWATVARVDTIADMRRTEAIRDQLRNWANEIRPDEPMQYLARAECIAIALRHADAEQPARIVATRPDTIATYQKFGLATTSVWDLLSSAAQEGRLDLQQLARPLRDLRQRLDKTFKPHTSGWPRPPQPRPKPPGSMRYGN